MHTALAFWLHSGTRRCEELELNSAKVDKLESKLRVRGPTRAVKRAEHAERFFLTQFLTHFFGFLKGKYLGMASWTVGDVGRLSVPNSQNGKPL